MLDIAYQHGVASTDNMAKQRVHAQTVTLGTVEKFPLSHACIPPVSSGNSAWHRNTPQTHQQPLPHQPDTHPSIVPEAALHAKQLRTNTHACMHARANTPHRLGKASRMVKISSGYDRISAQERVQVCTRQHRQPVAPRAFKCRQCLTISLAS